MLIPELHTYSQFDRIRARHELWNEKYPHRAKARGIPFTGLSNARPETLAIQQNLEDLREDLPFDPLEFMDWEEIHEAMIAEAARQGLPLTSHIHQLAPARRLLELGVDRLQHVPADELVDDGFLALAIAIAAGWLASAAFQFIRAR